MFVQVWSGSILNIVSRLIETFTNFPGGDMVDCLSPEENKASTALKSHWKNNARCDPNGLANVSKRISKSNARCDPDAEKKRGGTLNLRCLSFPTGVIHMAMINVMIRKAHPVSDINL